jgi:glycosyltransferase 2 family protein
MKHLWSRCQPYLRWVILGGTLFFLIKTLKDNWQEVATVHLYSWSWGFLALALAVTLAAHTWAGWVWGWILQELNQPVQLPWAARVYLKTNIAKYLPGNVWHYYGRVSAAKEIGIPLGASTLSVLLEPMLMAASALFVILFGSQPLLMKVQGLLRNVSWLSVTVLAIGLISIHPKILNPLMSRLRRLRTKPTVESLTPESASSQIRRYPLKPLLGEGLFLILRGTGFMCTLLAFGAIPLPQVALVFTAFSVAWLMGLVVPGAPGGIGVFEAVALALLKGPFTPGIVLSVVALYRLISILAETIGAGSVWIYDRRSQS